MAYFSKWIKYHINIMRHCDIIQETLYYGMKISSILIKITC